MTKSAESQLFVLSIRAHRELSLILELPATSQKAMTKKRIIKKLKIKNEKTIFQADNNARLRLIN